MGNMSELYNLCWRLLPARRPTPEDLYTVGTYVEITICWQKEISKTRQKQQAAISNGSTLGVILPSMPLNITDMMSATPPYTEQDERPPPYEETDTHRHSGDFESDLFSSPSVGFSHSNGDVVIDGLNGLYRSGGMHRLRTISEDRSSLPSYHTLSCIDLRISCRLNEK